MWVKLKAKEQEDLRIVPETSLVVDAEIVTARPNVSNALASINADPIACSHGLRYLRVFF
jgi:hypothetical protein